MNEAALQKLLQSNLYDYTAPAPTEQVVFRIQYKRIGSLGDFILFSGRPKSGKTKYLSGCIAAAISKDEVFDMSIRSQKRRCTFRYRTKQIFALENDAIDFATIRKRRHLPR